MSPSHRQSGFTLIELMVVMAIIAILATAGLSAYTGYIKRGRDTSRAALASQINTEVISYMGGNEGKPPADQTAFDAFLQSAADSLGRTPETILRDPAGGRDICLDAEGDISQPCSWRYTAYDDGTYAITYGVESDQTNFYKTTDGTSDQYGVSLGSAPYIGGPVTRSNSDAAANTTVPAFVSPRIDIVAITVYQAENTAILCSNNIDDDGDGMTDGADSDCGCQGPYWFRNASFVCEFNETECLANAHSYDEWAYCYWPEG